MKTMVRQESVRFGVVTQCGKHWAFAQTECGEVRLYWSQLRLVETVHGGVLFGTGKSPNVRRGDEVAFVPQKDGLWLWVLRADYETTVNFLQQSSPPLATPTVPPPMMPTPPAPVINLEQEITALGSAQLQKWQRRYGTPRSFA